MAAMKALRFLVCAMAWIAAVVCVAWAFGALYFDFPTAGAPMAFLFVLVVMAAVIFVRGNLLKLGVVFGAFALVALWWLMLKPGNDRAWQPDVAQTAWAQINGDEVTVHNVRNCDYRTETDFTPRWYNAVTSNCTTSIRTQRAVKLRAPWDWRILLNGKADEMLYDHHAIATGGLPFAELKQRSLINERARAADNDPDFSRLIREDLPNGN